VKPGPSSLHREAEGRGAYAASWLTLSKSWGCPTGLGLTAIGVAGNEGASHEGVPMLT
jgi:hypothetical protein